MADDPYAYLSGLSAHPDRAGDTSNLNPAFASPLANAIRQARAAGLPVGLGSGFRTPGQTGSAYDAGGNSSHSYGLASDISGLDGPNGKITNQWAQIAQANGLHNPYGVGNAAEFNHWQLPAQPLEENQQLLASLKQASASGNMQNVWSAYNAGGGPSRPATPTPTQTTMFSGLNPDARGMRNNNPGNLVDNAWTQSLPGYKGSDGKFAIFDTPQHGAGALDQNLAHYGTQGINTPLGVASTWAPASDNNNPNSYGAQIAKSLGVGLNDKIDINDPAVRSKVAQTIGLVENGPGKSAGFAVGVGAPTASTASTPGTTINSTPAGVTSGQWGQLAQNLKDTGKALGLSGDSQQKPSDIKPSPMIGPPPQARNVSPLLGNPQLYAQRMAALNQPMTWGGAPPGQMAGTGYGMQAQPSVFGTSLMSNQQRSLDPMWMNSWDG